MRNVTLILDDGSRFSGKSFGYEKPVAGEVVFYTAMTGYPESLTDPSYAGQLMTLTYPLVGNYGVPPFTIEPNGLATFMESEKIHAEAIIVSDYSSEYSHWNAVESLGDWLKREKVPGITGIDTRELTKILREHGVMMGRIVFNDEIVGEIDNGQLPMDNYAAVNYVARVSCKEILSYLPDGTSRSFPLTMPVAQLNCQLSTVNCQLSMGYLPQYSSIDRKFPITVEEVILSGLSSKQPLASRFTARHREKASAVIASMGLEGMEQRAIGALSGGQLQRALLGRAIISDPQVVILDEPSTYIDKRFEARLYELLAEINHDCAIILVSHDIGTVLQQVKSIACVNETLDYHPDTGISEEWLERNFNCPIELLGHGALPHRILAEHKHGDECGCCNCEH